MEFPTAAIADACVRLGLPVRVLAGLRPVAPARIQGPAIPARHAGSVDVFFEAMRTPPRGGVLVVDNGGRLDEGCVGDLTALEARSRGVVGMLVWGAHRDSADLVRMRFPVWSLGACPAGPLRLDARAPDALEAAHVGAVRVTAGDWVYADEDGAMAVPAGERARVEAAALAIVLAERRQAQLAENGRALHDQLDLEGYLVARAADPGLTFRAYLRSRGAAIEE